MLSCRPPESRTSKRSKRTSAAMPATMVNQKSRLSALVSGTPALIIPASATHAG